MKNVDPAAEKASFFNFGATWEDFERTSSRSEHSPPPGARGEGVGWGGVGGLGGLGGWVAGGWRLVAAWWLAAGGWVAGGWWRLG